ncbi:membrane or secreted protein [Flagellimonas meishanensis]|uniref:membrane or secreted protein n=1 Tax=Flagellimonas meishanensis TaxID=2873264 RepID=UPI00223B2A62|nr:membrane or secreted protein [[Muricauda] meishanensis]
MSLMKTRGFIVSLLFLCCSGMQSQSFEGAWQTELQNDVGTDIHYVAIFSDGFVSEASYEKESGKFSGTWGGSFEAKDGSLTYTFEFATFDSELVGSTEAVEYKFFDGKLHIEDKVWTRIDDGSPGDLAGAWLISGRMRGDEMQHVDASRPRKTMKILSGTQFQWIAYNTETKEFMGTGGGTYTTENGKYTEHIGFFSRDDSRVGASLEFDYKIKDGDWHHSGLSSKGTPIYEIWGKRTSSK